MAGEKVLTNAGHAAVQRLPQKVKDEAQTLADEVQLWVRMGLGLVSRARRLDGVLELLVTDDFDGDLAVEVADEIGHEMSLECLTGMAGIIVGAYGIGDADKARQHAFSNHNRTGDPAAVCRG